MFCKPGTVTKSVPAKALGKDPVQRSRAKLEFSYLVSQSARTPTGCCGFLVPITCQASMQVPNAARTPGEVPDLRRLSQQGLEVRDGCLKMKVQACQCGLKKKHLKEGCKDALCT